MKLWIFLIVCPFPTVFWLFILSSAYSLNSIWFHVSIYKPSSGSIKEDGHTLSNTTCRSLLFFLAGFPSPSPSSLAFLFSSCVFVLCGLQNIYSVKTLNKLVIAWVLTLLSLLWFWTRWSPKWLRQTAPQLFYQEICLKSSYLNIPSLLEKIIITTFIHLLTKQL